MRREIKIGSIYRHFKNKYYIVVDIVNDCESNNDDEYKKIVIYRALYGKFLTWARPYDMFNSEVDREKYPNVNQHYRFEEIDYDAYMIRESLDAHRMVMNAEISNLKDEILRFEIQQCYNNLASKYDELPLDKIIYLIYQNINFDGLPFFQARNIITNTLNIDEFAYYTAPVCISLKDYVSEHIFPQYQVNDNAHGIAHIQEVIRRAFALNETFNLGLNPNLIYTIAAYHDLGKYEDHKTHEKIAAKRFLDDEFMCQFFNDDERKVIAEAIEDHRSSRVDSPRSIYGQLISSADRNTSIDMVFTRSFFVAHERMPDAVINDYLDYTIKRLSKKYSEENSENMFFADETYRMFLLEMRELLKKPDEFKDTYCKINNIDSRYALVKECPCFAE